MHDGGRNWQVRRRNAGIARAARRHHVSDGEPVWFLCECDDSACDAYVHLALRPHDRARDARLYIVAPGHTIAAAERQRGGETFDAYRRIAPG